MRQHDALRNTCRSGGINQRSHALCSLCVNHLWFDFVIQRPNRDWAQSSDILDDCPMPFGMFPSMWRDARRVDHSAGAAVIPNLIDLARGKTCIDQNRPCIQTLPAPAESQRMLGSSRRPA